MFYAADPSDGFWYDDSNMPDDGVTPPRGTRGRNWAAPSQSVGEVDQ